MHTLRFQGVRYRYLKKKQEGSTSGLKVGTHVRLPVKKSQTGLVASGSACPRTGAAQAQHVLGSERPGARSRARACSVCGLCAGRKRMGCVRAACAAIPGAFEM